MKTNIIWSLSTITLVLCLYSGLNDTALAGGRRYAVRYNNHNSRGPDNLYGPHNRNDAINWKSEKRQQYKRDNEERERNKLKEQHWNLGGNNRQNQKYSAMFTEPRKNTFKW